MILSASDKLSSAAGCNIERLNADMLYNERILLSIAKAAGSVASSSAGLIMKQIYFDYGSNVP